MGASVRIFCRSNHRLGRLQGQGRTCFELSRQFQGAIKRLFLTGHPRNKAPVTRLFCLQCAAGKGQIKRASVPDFAGESFETTGKRRLANARLRKAKSGTGVCHDQVAGKDKFKPAAVSCALNCCDDRYIKPARGQTCETARRQDYAKPGLNRTEIQTCTELLSLTTQNYAADRGIFFYFVKCPGHRLTCRYIQAVGFCTALNSDDECVSAARDTMAQPCLKTQLNFMCHNYA